MTKYGYIYLWEAKVESREEHLRKKLVDYHEKERNIHQNRLHHMMLCFHENIAPEVTDMILNAIKEETCWTSIVSKVKKLYEKIQIWLTNTR